MKSSKKFNPFNLEDKELDSNSKIKFRRLEKRINTRPLWWLIILFILIVFLFIYLKGQG